MFRRTLIIGTASLVAGCASSTGPDPAATRREIDIGVDHALADLYANARGARGLTDKAQAVLVFPKVFSAGLVIGGTYGQGALRKGQNTMGYYSVGGGSAGLLAGAQTKEIYVLFMTDDALRRFLASEGWTAGADASVVLLDAGAEARMDTDTAKAPVIGLVRGQQGFMANLSLDGTKFTRLKL